MSRGRELLAGALLAAFGMLFAFLVLEAGVRLLHLVPDRFWEPDPQLGVRLIPGRSGWWTQEDREFVIPIRINSHGRRDVERDYAKPPGSIRVLVLGDSFVEAMHVPLEATFTRLLEQELNGKGGKPQIEVIAAGVSGYGTASELLYYRRDGRRYEPDLVILAFYPGNDLKNNSPTLEDTLNPVYASDGELKMVKGEGKKQEVHGWRGLVARLKAYHFLRQLLLVRQPALAQRLVRMGLLKAEAVKQAPQREGVPVDYGVYAPTLSSEWQEAWQHTEWLFGHLQREVEANGARFMVAILSTRDQVYPESWQQIVASHTSMQGQAWELDAPQHRAEAWCAANNASCLALAPAFRSAAQPGSEPLHFAHDGHWTVAGHRLAAKTLSEFIEQHQLVAARSEGASHEVH